ncbi:MAG: hypothetical protein ACLT8E_00085 [Akkermansia sp.]
MDPAGRQNGNEGVQTGDKLDITLKDGTKYPEQATVVAMLTGVQPQTGTIRVQANLPNADYLFAPRHVHHGYGPAGYRQKRADRSGKGSSFHAGALFRHCAG